MVIRLAKVNNIYRKSSLYVGLCNNKNRHIQSLTEEAVIYIVQISASGQHITSDWQQTPTVTSPDSDSGFSQPSPQFIPQADPIRCTIQIVFSITPRMSIPQ